MNVENSGALNRITWGGLFFFDSEIEKKFTPRQIPDGYFWIEIITSGNVYYGQGSSRRLYETGTIFWHEAGDWTIGEVGDKKRYAAIAFIASYKSGKNWRPAHISHWDDIAELKLWTAQWMRDLFDEHIDNNVLGEFIFSCCYYKVYSYLHQKSQRMSLPFLNALEILNKNENLTISVNELAKMCHVSVSYLFLLFKRHLGGTPHQYILTRRCKYAQYLLQGTTASIKSIVKDCGFSSIENFYHVFKARFGMSPAQFRQNGGFFPYVDKIDQ